MGTFFVIKRDGSRIGFEIQRIINAIKKAAQAVGIQDERFCHDIAQKLAMTFLHVISRKLILATFKRL